MNNDSENSKSIFILIIMFFLLIFGLIYYYKDDFAYIQKQILYLDFYIYSFFPFLQFENFNLYQEYVHSSNFNIVGFDIGKNFYWNLSDEGETEYIFEELYNKFYIFNSIIATLIYTPFLYIMYKFYSKPIIKYKIPEDKKQEEAYPGLIKTIRRKDKNDIYEVMDYLNPIIVDKKEYFEGSMRISMKMLDSNFSINQKKKLAKIKKSIKSNEDKFNYYKLIYLHIPYIKEINDEDLLDYIRYLRYKDLKPKRNTKKKVQDLPKKLTKNNFKKIMKILQENLLPPEPTKEFGRIIVPQYYILTPLKNQELIKFKTKGSIRLTKILKKYIEDDYKKDQEKSLKKLKQEIKEEKRKKNPDLELIELNKSLIDQIKLSLTLEDKDTRASKIRKLATIHKFEETFLIALLLYGRTLVNLPMGILSQIKFENTALWYALTSLGRTFTYNPAIPIMVIYNVEKEKDAEKKEELLDVENLDPEKIISNKTLEKAAQNAGIAKTRRKKYK